MRNRFVRCQALRRVNLVLVIVHDKVEEKAGDRDDVEDRSFRTNVFIRISWKLPASSKDPEEE